jgi:hypothetical protein
MPFPAFCASKFAPKFMLIILVLEIKEGKNVVVEKSYNLNLIDFVKLRTENKDGPKIYFLFIYL